RSLQTSRQDARRELVLFDTRYFWAVFTTKNPEQISKLRSILDESKNAFASTVSLYEIYKLTLSDEDRTVADLRVASVKKEFTIVDVDTEITENGERISHRVSSPMTTGQIME